MDFPIAVVSKHAAREKSIRHGHPSTLHLWWARRPLASSRAVLLALLWPDPCDPLCPEGFKQKARQLLPDVQGPVGLTDEDLRKALLKFIGYFANWDLAANRNYLDVSRALVRAAHGEEPPLVVDPFAGGGSIPLEALRLGCEAFASDLNPVACLILKVMLEEIPRHGPALAGPLQNAGTEAAQTLRTELSKLYPVDADGATPLVYFWARTVRCEAPQCGVEIPLMRSFWLSTRRTRKYALRYRIDRFAAAPPRLTFEVFSPSTDSEVLRGTLTQARSTCPGCGSAMSKDRLREQLRNQRGGANPIFSPEGERVGGSLLLAKLVRTPTGLREYRSASPEDYGALREAATRLKAVTGIPDESFTQERVAKNSPFRIHLYGVKTFGDLFTVRQKLALHVLGRSTSQVPDPSTRSLMACVASRCADYWSSLVVWAKGGEFVAHTFGRQALSIVWDFAEVVPFGDVSGSLDGAVEWVSRVVERWPTTGPTGQSQQLDACRSPLPTASAAVWFTDPPYYDAVSYADLSDYFFVWLKRMLPTAYIPGDTGDPSNPLTPKAQEIIQDDFKVYNGQPKDRGYYERKMADAFREGRRVLQDSGVGCVVFAHKTTEGWEALLSGMIRGGWTITGSWPIATERPGRLRSQESAALATSVHLVCRPRPEDAPVGDWADVLRELPNKVGDWMERLQSEDVRGADLVFACIGPALEIFSRHTRVIDAEEREIPLGGDPEAAEPYKRGYLTYVWEVVGRTALEQILGTAEARARNGAAGSLEEDARLTALFLWTLQSTNGSETDEPADDDEPDEKDEDEDSAAGKKKPGFSLVYDVVRRFAQPLGIHLPEWEARIIETEKGVVRLLSVGERAKQLFGEDGADAMADYLERNPNASPQLALFPDSAKESAPEIKRRGRRKAGVVSDESLQARREATTLDRVHAAMLLQRSGRANALRALLTAGKDRSPDFLRLANALSALYPKESEEKRLLDAMLLAAPR